MSGAEEVIFSLKVMINKEKTKVLFAESDGHFVDVLLSFLTMPLGRIVKVLEKHYGDEAPVIGSLSTFYNSVVNLDSVHFWTEGAKLILLNPTSSFEQEYRGLKLDISDSKPKFFSCPNCLPKGTFWCVSVYYDEVISCRICSKQTVKRKSPRKHPRATLSGGVFTVDTTTFIITDDLQIFPSDIGLLRATSILDAKGTDDAELVNVTFGLSEIMNLLKASMISRAPLSDLILNKTRQMDSVAVESEAKTTSLHQIKREETPNSKKMILKVTVQKSTNRLLFAQAREDFIEFLLSSLTIPLGGVEWLLSSETSIKSIDNLYRSVSYLIDDKCFVTPHIKEKLINPKLPHGYISKNQILPLTEESLPKAYNQISLFSSLNFPQGQGNYIKGPRTYQVFDDLTFKPFYMSSVIYSLNQLKIPVSDVKELEMNIGLEEALSILKASLTSNSALTKGLLNHISNKRPKPNSALTNALLNHISKKRPKQET